MLVTLRGQRVNSSQHRYVPWTELVHTDLLSLRELSYVPAILYLCRPPKR